MDTTMKKVKNLLLGVAAFGLLYVPLPAFSDMPAEHQTSQAPSAPEADWKAMVLFLTQKDVFPTDHAGFLVEYFRYFHPEEYSAVHNNEIQTLEEAKKYRSELKEAVDPHMALPVSMEMASYNFANNSFALGWDKNDFFLSHDGMQPLAYRGNAGAKYLQTYIPLKLLNGLPEAWKSLRMDQDSSKKLLEMMDNKRHLYGYVVGWVGGYSDSAAIIVPQSLWLYTSKEKERLIAAIDVAGVPLPLTDGDDGQKITQKAYQILAQDDGGLGLGNAVTIGGEEENAEHRTQPAEQPETSSSADENIMPAAIISPTAFNISAPSDDLIKQSRKWIEAASKLQSEYEFIGGGCPLSTFVKGIKDKDEALKKLKSGLEASQECTNLDEAAAFQLVKSINEKDIEPWEVIIPHMRPIQKHERMLNYLEHLSDKKRTVILEQLTAQKKLDNLGFIDAMTYIADISNRTEKHKIAQILSPILSEKGTVQDLSSIYPRITHKQAYFDELAQYSFFKEPMVFDELLSALKSLKVEKKEEYLLIIDGIYPLNQKINGEELVEIAALLGEKKEKYDDVNELIRKLADTNRISNTITPTDLVGILDHTAPNEAAKIIEEALPFMKKGNSLQSFIPVLKHIEKDLYQKKVVTAAVKEGVIRLNNLGDLNALSGTVDQKTIKSIIKALD